MRWGGSEENILALEVTMEDVDRMEILQPTTDAHTQRLDGTRRERYFVHMKKLRGGEGRNGWKKRKRKGGEEGGGREDRGEGGKERGRKGEGKKERWRTCRQ